MKLKKKIKILSGNLRTLKHYRTKKVFLNTPPSYIWLEPTNHCNLRCIMCPTGTGKVNIEKGYMDYSFYKKIIDEIKDYTSLVTLAVNGESMLHPNFFDMVKYASLQNVKVLLNTNATLLNEEKAYLLLNSGLAYISFAFDGYNKRMYENARVGSHFEKTLGNILYFLRLKKNKKRNLPYAVLSILKLELEECSKVERQDFLQRFDGLIDEIRLREVSTWGRTFKNTDKFSYKINTEYYPPCSRLWSTICISCNGDVVPCIYNANHEYILGNLKENELMDIWNSEKMLALRKAMLDGTYLKISPLCENCIVLGCRPIMGIPSGIRLTLSDAISNIMGYKFEKLSLWIINKLQRGRFSSVTIQ